MLRMYRLLDRCVLMAGFALLLPSFIYSLYNLYAPAPEDVFRFFSTTREQRRLAYYGNLSGTGYGYIKQIVQAIPEAKFFPVTRYSTYTQNAHLFFPFERKQIDSRMIVGINLTAHDLKESPIVQAKNISQNFPPRPNQTFWAFATSNDYDTLTGFRIKLGPSSAPIEKISIFLFTGPGKDGQPGFSWNWSSISSDSEIFLKLPEQLDSFSFDRGHKPFVIALSIHSSSLIVPEQVVVYGIKVNLKNYTIINQIQSCFTAIDNKFLAQIRRSYNIPWLNYIESIRNV